MNLLQHQWQQSGRNISIQHARSPNGEKSILCQGKTKTIKYKVDGYFEYDETKYVAEYHGCNFHGCINCFPRDRETTMNSGKSIAQRYRDTMVKEKRLIDAGYVVLRKWSCEFAKEKKHQPIKEFVDSLNIQEPINIRDCYFGGRTNGIVLHKKFEDGEKGYYVDFTSLYPDILKYRRFPAGHAQRSIDNFTDCYQKPCDGNCFHEKCEGWH